MANGGFDIQAPDVGFTGFATKVEPDTTTQNLIKGLSSFAGTGYKESVRAGLRKDLRETGQAVAGVRQGLSNEEILAQSDLQGEALKQQENRLKRLRSAVDQGRISPTQATLEVENVTRQAISRAPGFEPEFRDLANNIFRGSPSTIEINALFGDVFNPQKVEENPILVQARQEAQAIGKGDDPQYIESIATQIVRQDQMERQRKLAQDQAEIGDISTTEYANTVANLLVNSTGMEVQKRLNQLVGENFVEDQQAVVDGLSQLKQQTKQQYRNQVTSQFPSADQSQLQPGLNAIDAQFKPLEDALANKDFRSFLKSNLEELQLNSKIQIYRDLPFLALARDAGLGQSALELLKIESRTPAGAKAIENLTPEMRAVVKLRDASRTFDERMDFLDLVSGSRPPQNDEERKAVNGVVDSATQSNDPGRQEEGANIISRLHDDAGLKAFSVSKLPNREQISPGKAMDAYNTFVTTNAEKIDSQAERVGASFPIEDENTFVGYIDGKKLVAVDKARIDDPTRIGGEVQRGLTIDDRMVDVRYIDNKGEVKTAKVSEADVSVVGTPPAKYLSAWSIAANRGWSQQMGYMSPDDYQKKTLQRIYEARKAKEPAGKELEIMTTLEDGTEIVRTPDGRTMTREQYNQEQGE